MNSRFIGSSEESSWDYKKEVLFLMWAGTIFLEEHSCFIFYDDGGVYSFWILHKDNCVEDLLIIAEVRLILLR